MLKAATSEEEQSIEFALFLLILISGGGLYQACGDGGSEALLWIWGDSHQQWKSLGRTHPQTPSFHHEQLGSEVRVTQNSADGDSLPSSPCGLFSFILNQVP